jgi:hypothetical protein
MCIAIGSSSAVDAVRKSSPSRLDWTGVGRGRGRAAAGSGISRAETFLGIGTVV